MFLNKTCCVKSNNKYFCLWCCVVLFVHVFRGTCWPFLPPCRWEQKVSPKNWLVSVILQASHLRTLWLSWKRSSYCYILSCETTSLWDDYQCFRGKYCFHVQHRSDQGEKGARLYWQQGLWLENRRKNPDCTSP